MNKLKFTLTTKRLIFGLISIIFVLLNIGNFYDLIFNDDTSLARSFYYFSQEPELQDKMLYIDSACDVSFFESYQHVEFLEEKYTSSINTNFYNFVTNKLECINRLATSNSNDLIIQKNSDINLSIGIGLFEDVENLKRGAFFNLFFLLISMFYSKNEIILKFKNLLILNLFVLAYSFLILVLVQNSFMFWITSMYIPLVFQTNIFNIIFHSVDKRVALNTLITLCCFSLFFFHSSLSFYTSVVLVLMSSVDTKIVKKNFLVSFMLLLPVQISLLINISSFEFNKPVGYDYSILLQPGFFNNTIVNQNDGYKLLLLFVNINMLVLLMAFIKQMIQDTNQLRLDLYKCLLNGFLIWSILSIVSNISNYLKITIANLFGFFENTDSTFNFMWSGVNQGYEMTSFWFLVLMVIASYLVLIKREYIYLLHLGILFIFTNLNGSRTAFILYIISLLIIFFLKSKETSKKSLGLLFLVFVVFNLIFPQSLNRVIKKAQEIDCNYVISSQLRNTDQRTEYDLNISTYSLTFKEVLDEKTKLNEFNKNIIAYSGCLLSRQVEWARFFVISELEGKQKFIGYGYGNSYEKLVFEIEKPHSLILSLYYQIGLIGVLYYLIIFIYGLYSIIVSQKEDNKELRVLLLGLFFLNALKTTFTFTIWGLLFTLFFLTLNFTKQKNT